MPCPTAVAALRAAVLAVSFAPSAHVYVGEVTMTATITEAAALDACSLLKASLNKFIYEGSDGDGERVWYVQARDRETGRTFWLNLSSEDTSTGYAVVMHVHNSDGLDYTRELDEPTLDDRLAFASIVRRLFT